MKDESTTFGLSREKLAQLWEVGNEARAHPDASSEDQARAEFLRDQLAEPVPLDSTVCSALPEALRHVLERFHPLAACSVGSLLLDPDTDPAVIRQIKDRYRRQAESGPSAPLRHVATALYYAAIAHAVLFQEKALFQANRITTFSYGELEEYFSQWLHAGWLTPDLVNLFQKAQAVCRERKEVSSP
ncbi:MAG: hypothetical protein FJ280_00195 [Planctomycetes bacterium]|nr:hypothetical protein [Planctomycetota bacterium]